MPGRDGDWTFYVLYLAGSGDCGSFVRPNLILFLFCYQCFRGDNEFENDESAVHYDFDQYIGQRQQLDP